MADLAVHFNIGHADAPKPIPYIKADHKLVEKIKPIILKKAKGRKIIGLSWYSKGNHAKLRSFNLEHFKAIRRREDLCFINLQYSADNTDDSRLFKHLFPKITLLQPAKILNQDVNFFDDIEMHAAFIEACDAILTITNFTCSLAGTMGKKMVLMASPLNNFRIGEIVSEKGCWFSNVKKIRYQWNQPREEVVTQAFDLLDQHLNLTKPAKLEKKTKKQPPKPISAPKTSPWIEPFIDDLKHIEFSDEHLKFLNQMMVQYNATQNVKDDQTNTMPLGPYDQWVYALAVLGDHANKMIPDPIQDALIDCCRQILKIRSDIAEPWQWMSGTLLRFDQPHECENILRNACKKFPNDAELKSNLAVCLTDLHQFKEADKLFFETLKLSKNHYNYRFNYAWFLLKTGRFKEAWPLLEARLETDQFKRFIRPFDIPRWQGQSLKDKIIFISAEQGLGEQIMFARLADRLSDQAKHVYISCKPKLEPLMQRSLKATTAIGAFTKEHLFCKQVKADYYLEMGSMPLQCRLFEN
ncbi:MAG: hypothetical protein AAF403_07640, partial [Pseudomonadota bacterium]